MEEGGGAGLSKNEGILAGAGSLVFGGSAGVGVEPKLKDGTGGFGGAASGFWKKVGTARPPAGDSFSVAFGGGGFGVGVDSGAGVGVALANPLVVVGPNAEPFAVGAGAGAFWNALPEEKALLGPNALPVPNAAAFFSPNADEDPLDEGNALDVAGADGAGTEAGVDESIFFGWYTGAETRRGARGTEEGTVIAAGLPSTETPPAPLTTSAYDVEPCLSVMSFHRRVNGASLLSVGQLGGPANSSPL